jgi:hypothetical protein
MTSITTNSFVFEEGPGILTPRAMLELPRATPGVPNPTGDLLVSTVAQWSFDEQRCVFCPLIARRSLIPARSWTRTLAIVPINKPDDAACHALERPGELLWLDAHTLLQVAADNVSNSDAQALYVLSVTYDATRGGQPQVSAPRKIGVLPTSSARDFVYGAAAGVLVRISLHDLFDII